MFGDNRPAIFSMGNETSKSRTKHMDVRLKFCGEVLKHGLLQNEYVPAADNIADIFTKPLPAPRFRLLRDELVSDIQVFINNCSSAMAKLLVMLKQLDTCMTVPDKLLYILSCMRTSLEGISSSIWNRCIPEIWVCQN